MKEYMQAGINMVGGCCGTTPEYIAGLAECRDEMVKNGVPGLQGKKDMRREGKNAAFGYAAVQMWSMWIM